MEGDTSFDEARQRSRDRFAVIVLQEETTIGGHRAVRYETEATGARLFPKGSHLSSVVIDNEGQAFEVVTAWFPGLRLRNVDSGRSWWTRSPRPPA